MPVPRKYSSSCRTELSLMPRCTTVLTLTGGQTGSCGGPNPGQHLGQSVKAAIHVAKDHRVERIQAHGDTPQPVRPELHRVLHEEYRVRRESRVLDAVDRGQVTHQLGEVARSSGSPPVSLSLRTPRPTNARATRRISCGDSRSLDFRKR